MTDPRIAKYETNYQCELDGYFGHGPGQDGFVLRSDRMTAVKFFDQSHRFNRELEVYQILLLRKIEMIAGHTVPVLYDFDVEMLAIEMTVVDRPFILDFASARLPHEMPDFEPHVMEEHFKRIDELYGNRAADALHVAEVFRREIGYTILDIHPGNIAFGD
jgi:hypothetical protein